MNSFMTAGLAWCRLIHPPNPHSPPLPSLPSTPLALRKCAYSEESDLIRKSSVRQRKSGPSRWFFSSGPREARGASERARERRGEARRGEERTGTGSAGSTLASRQAGGQTRMEREQTAHRRALGCCCCCIMG